MKKPVEAETRNVGAPISPDEHRRTVWNFLMLSQGAQPHGYPMARYIAYLMPDTYIPKGQSERTKESIFPSLHSHLFRGEDHTDFNTRYGNPEQGEMVFEANLDTAIDYIEASFNSERIDGSQAQEVLRQLVDHMAERDEHYIGIGKQGRPNRGESQDSFLKDRWASFLVSYVFLGKKTGTYAFDEMLANMREAIQANWENDDPVWERTREQARTTVDAYNSHHEEGYDLEAMAFLGFPSRHLPAEK